MTLKYKPSISFFFKWKFNKFSIADFNIKLSYELWDNVFNENYVNICFNNFLNTYMKLFNFSFPLKKIYCKSTNTAWLTSGIKTSYLNKRKLYINLRNTNDPKLTAYYKKYCRILTRVIKLAKQKYYSSLISRSSNKNETIWNIINSSINKKLSITNITSINVNGIPTNNGHSIAEAFNKHFVSIAQEMYTTKLKVNASSNHTNPLHYLTQISNHPFPLINIKYVSISEVVKVTKSLKKKDSYGYDEISTKVLSFSTDYISSPLTYIINRMLATSTFPNRIKLSQIKPLYKKGEQNNLSNYRPISLLTSFSKIVEKIIYNKLHQHINDNHSLASEQLGF